MKKGIFLIVLLFILTALVHAPGLNNGFVHWDDEEYVIKNFTIQTLSLRNIKELFTSHAIGNQLHDYQPLTLLSFMLEYHFFKTKAAAYHTTNLILHGLNTLCVFLFLFALTKKHLTAFLTALLFGIHPMQVETVASIASRKDLLYAFFYLAALVSYCQYMEVKKRRYFLAVYFLFLLSLFSKSTALTLPFVLVILDIYLKGKVRIEDLLLKLPLIILAILWSIFIFTQRLNAGIVIENIYSIWDRFFLGSFTLTVYFIKALIPFPLSAYYPLPDKQGGFLPSIFYLSILIWILSAGILMYTFNNSRKIFLGISFFVLTIFLLLGFIPIGNYLLADRYVYIPYIGLFFLIVEGIIYLRTKIKTQLPRTVFTIFFIAVFIVLSWISHERTNVWKEGVSLWSDVIKNYPKVSFAYINRAVSYLEQKDYRKAMDDLTTVISNTKESSVLNLSPIFEPLLAKAYSDRGTIYQHLGNLPMALDDYNKALKINPAYAEGYNNRAALFFRLQKFDLTLEDLNRALILNPTSAVGYKNRGVVYRLLGKKDLALSDFKKALQYKSDYDEVLSYLVQMNGQ